MVFSELQEWPRLITNQMLYRLSYASAGLLTSFYMLRDAAHDAAVYFPVAFVTKAVAK